MELLVVELTVVVVVPVAAAWETDSGSRDVGVAFDTDGTDSGLVNHNGLVRRGTVGHGIVDHGTDHGIVGVRSVVELVASFLLFDVLLLICFYFVLFYNF